MNYDKNVFGEKEQERLRDFAEKLDKKKVKFIVSNANTEHINRIWKNFNIEHVIVPRTISCNTGSINHIRELIIRNYD